MRVQISPSIPADVPAQERVHAPISGWEPPTRTYTPSVRRSGPVGAAFDAIRGITEHGDGQPLTDAQVATLAPFLATSYELPIGTVHSDLRAVRIYTGGAASGNGGWAVTMGHDIYVANNGAVDRMMSWEGRRWLAHELGHTMQWRRTGGDSDVSRTRRFLWTYTARNVLDEGFRPGAVPRGTWTWLRAKIGHPDPSHGEPSSLKSAIHDAHSMEDQAQRIAIAFRDATA